jgi:enoyl-CoA hydratase/carnithine racemase
MGMQTIEIESKRWGAMLRLSRPPVNAMSTELVSELADAVERLTEERPAVVVLTGDGHCFSAGADLKEAHLTAESLLARFSHGRRVLDALREAPFPTIAAVNGACMGAGMNLIANCDLRVAHERAVFGLPEIKRGRAGGAANLRGVLTEGYVRWLALTGDNLDAAEAARVGLVQRVFADSAWESEVDALAARIAQAGHTGLYAIKEGLRKTRTAPIGDAHWIEQQLSFRLWAEGKQGPWTGEAAK